MELLKSQKNEVFNILQVENLPLSDFKWGTVGDYSTLNYKNREFYFDFEIHDQETFYFEYSPGKGARKASFKTEFWQDVLDHVGFWANNLKREITAPDLWEEFKKYKTSFSLVPSEEIVNGNIPFHEVEKIIEALHSLESEIKERFELDDQQDQFVHSKLEYLEDAVKRQGRYDWVHTCIGVLLPLAFQLALNSEAREVLINLFKTFLGPYITLIGP